MLLIDAIGMVADAYPEDAGWIIQCPEGQIEMVIGPFEPSYSCSDHMLLRANRRLEVVVAEFTARYPASTKYEHWKISPREAKR